MVGFGEQMLFFKFTNSIFVELNIVSVINIDDIFKL